MDLRSASHSHFLPLSCIPASLRSFCNSCHSRCRSAVSQPSQTPPCPTPAPPRFCSRRGPREPDIGSDQGQRHQLIICFDRSTRVSAVDGAACRPQRQMMRRYGCKQRSALYDCMSLTDFPTHALSLQHTTSFDLPIPYSDMTYVPSPHESQCARRLMHLLDIAIASGSLQLQLVVKYTRICLKGSSHILTHATPLDRQPTCHGCSCIRFPSHLSIFIDGIAYSVT
jgi:hypothetical protein